MRRGRLIGSERQVLRMISLDELVLRKDLVRRVRNAILCLAQLDRGWIFWIERNLPASGSISWRDVVLVESRARALLLKKYSFFGHTFIAELLFRQDQPFDDLGNLLPG